MLRFRLRTLLIVVALLAVPMAWVGFSLRWIAQRRWARAVAIEIPRVEPYDRTAAPAGLWLFGERSDPYLDWFPNADLSLEDAKRLFPESTVVNGDLHLLVLEPPAS